MNVKQHLSNLLNESSSYELTKQDEKLIDSKGIEEFIFKKLTTKKFRKYKLQDGCENRTRKAINIKVSNDEPIRIVYPQGGYKLWRFPTSPKADWAELFNISYVLKYIAPIANAYKEGVHLTYYMHTLLMEKHDNLTTKEIQKYVGSFQTILNEFSKHLPQNIKIDILRDADLYSRKEYFKALESGTVEATKKYNKLSKEKKEHSRTMSMLNIKWSGQEDWTVLSKEGKEEKLKMAAIYEMAAVSELDKVTKVIKADENVLVFTKGTPQFIGIGSTKSSIAKFWVGYGVLVKNKDTFKQIILTPKQYETTIKQKYSVETVNSINDENFKDVMVFDKPFNFHKK